MKCLEIKNLSFIYGRGTNFESLAVNNVSLSIEKGEIIGIIGRTGSGKSTLVQMINGLIKPSSGNIYLYGKDIWRDFRSIRDVHFKIGLVFQYPEHQLFEENIFKDISFGPHNQGLSESEIKNRVYNAIEFVDFPESLLNKSPFELSGGEKRRAAIAGIIAMNPELLILDEPTAGLDPIGRKNLMNAIVKYQEGSRSSVILISHNMEDVAKICNRVIAMDSGEIKFFDTPRNVFSRLDELKKIGLDVPSITKIISIIYNNGFDVDKKSVTVEEGEAEILKLLNAKVGV